MIDCINPILTGQAQRPQAKKPLPQISPEIVAACRAKNAAKGKGVGPDGGTGGVSPNGGSGGVGPNGGSVDHLYFAIVGNTRPSVVDDTPAYPTAIISKIYQDVEALDPRPQFIVATGDYMFASPAGGQAQQQINLYLQARKAYSGTVFAAMGNHECNGHPAQNCNSVGQTQNLHAFMTALVTPLGRSEPYYAVDINATDGSWTSKLIVVACNLWSTTQRSWLQTQLARPTTYTVLARNEPAATTTAPCVNDVENLMKQYPYDLSLVGHSPTFSGSGGSKQILVGTGGAPLSSNAPYGYATVERVSSGWRVKQYDYSSSQLVNAFVIP